MIRAALLALTAFACAPAHAQTINEEDGGRCLGRLLITNLETGITEQTTLHEVGGIQVGVIYHSTPNWTFNTDPRDIVTVTVPEGYAAIPSEIILDENATVEVLICEAIVG